jgi:hypothetical protein
MGERKCLPLAIRSTQASFHGAIESALGRSRVPPSELVMSDVYGLRPLLQGPLTAFLCIALEYKGETQTTDHVINK